MSDEFLLNETFLKECKTNFYNNPKYVFAQNACTKAEPYDVCISRKRIQELQHEFNYKVEFEGKPVSEQKKTGRCWIFACLNAIRIPFMRKYELDEFEFSQAYLFFWDKIERSFFFLKTVVKTARHGEPIKGRLMSFLLENPINDAGQWDLLVNLIKKHGLVPKAFFPESSSTDASCRMNVLLRSKLREFSLVLRTMVEEGSDNDTICETIMEQMSTVYHIAGICLGIPPTHFTWEYVTKDMKHNSVGPLTGLEFYENYVKPVFNLDDKVCLVNDPRPNNPYNKVYTIEYCGNVSGGRDVVYNNQPVELLAQLAAESIKTNLPVWFGCDVDKRFAWKWGLGDLKLHDFKLAFGADVSLPLTKAERLMHGDSAMNHAMIFTAVNVNDEGKPTKWRVEDSEGENHGDNGYILLTQEWFNEYVYEIVVDKSIVPEPVLEVFKQEPIVLPAWDPMGTCTLPTDLENQ